MQRLNRSTHAPVGTAFLLFLGLAILPVSLRTAGVQLSFSPRLSAAMDAWQQIAEVFGASYSPVAAFELALVKDLETNPSNPSENADIRPSEFACTQKIENCAGTVLDIPRARVLNEASAPRSCPRAESRRSHSTDRVAPVVEAEAIKTGFEEHATAINALGAMKLATLTRTHLIKNIEKAAASWKHFEFGAEVRTLPVPGNVRVLVRRKRAAAGFSVRTAECKVSAALAAAQRRACDRAMLTSVPFISPDNSEF